jgi:hypothetical protein
MRTGGPPRSAVAAELAEIAAAIDTHYAGPDFARQWDETRLAGRLDALARHLEENPE